MGRDLGSSGSERDRVRRETTLARGDRSIIMDDERQYFGEPAYNREDEPHDRESSLQHERKSPDDIFVGDCRSSSAITCRRRRDQRGYLEISDDE